MTLEIKTFIVMNQNTGEREIIEAPCKDAAREVYRDIFPHVRGGAIYIREADDYDVKMGIVS